MKTLFLTLLFSAMIVSTGCAKTATVEIKPTTEGSAVSGTLTLEEVAEGLKVTAEIQGATPGKHGFHVHENGSCGEEGKAAGGHFNPDKAPHGLLSKDGFTHAHAGDLGNIEIAADGKGKLETVAAGLSLSEGTHNVSGKAVILHEKEDDFGQPTGNAGGRVGCGVIE